MTFGAPDDEELAQRRYTSREDALRGHAEMLAEVHRRIQAASRGG